MGILEDVLKALDRIPMWKRLSSMPDEVDALRARVAALEAHLAKAIGDQCPRCRAMAYGLIDSGPASGPAGELGIWSDRYACSACGYQNQRERT